MQKYTYNNTSLRILGRNTECSKLTTMLFLRDESVFIVDTYSAKDPITARLKRAQR